LDDFASLIGPLKAAGASGVAIFVVYSIIRGWLVPARTVTQLLADRDKQIDNLWKAQTANDQSIAQMAKQLQHMANSAELQVMLLAALKKIATDQKGDVVGDDEMDGNSP
jgi:peptidoglycan hydrolase CwlO-like protein